VDAERKKALISEDDFDWMFSILKLIGIDTMYVPIIIKEKVNTKDKMKDQFCFGSFILFSEVRQRLYAFQLVLCPISKYLSKYLFIFGLCGLNKYAKYFFCTFVVG
jgi:hypothetical protein